MEIIAFILLMGLYFLPSFLGWHKRNSGAILILNLFLGWTFVGWVVAIVWACTNDPEPTKTIIINQPEKKEEKTWTKEELQRMLDKMNDENK